MLNNLDKLSERRKPWPVSFKAYKYKMLYIGYQNEKAKHILNGTRLKSIDSKVDLGVTVMSSLKSSQQHSELLQKSKKLIGLIGRSIKYI